MGTFSSPDFAYLNSAEVSIQLMSPASGNEWLGKCSPRGLPRVSIQLMSPASGNCTINVSSSIGRFSFHSINVPSEWEPGRILILQNGVLFLKVSIQLMSPASGNVTGERLVRVIEVNVSIQLMSPASGNGRITKGRWKAWEFPFN